MKIYSYLALFFICFHTTQANAIWEYVSELVGIDDFVKNTATTHRIESKSRDIPYSGKDKATLTIINNPDENTIKISIFYSKGNTVCGRFEITCRVKFDNEPSFPVSFINSNNQENSVLWIDPPEIEKILEKILNHEVMKVEIKYPTAPPDYLEFRIAGLDRHKVTLLEISTEDPRNPSDSSFFSPYFGREDNDPNSSKYETSRKYWEDKEAKKKESPQDIGVNTPICKKWPDGEIIEIDSGFKKIISSSANPVYPAMSRRANEKGNVTIRFVIKSTGVVGEYEITNSSGHKRLDDSAVEAIKSWKFIPATRKGKGLNCWAVQTFNFGLLE